MLGCWSALCSKPRNSRRLRNRPFPTFPARSDEEADRILENFRARAEVVKKEQEAMQKAEEEAWRATAIQSFWGPALKA